MDQEAVLGLQKVADKCAEATRRYLQQPEDRAAKQRALHEARQLVQELEDGDDAFFSKIEGITAAYTLRFVLSIGVIEKLPVKGSISAKDLAIAVGADESIIVRMMRLLCATGSFDEVTQDHYAHNKQSLKLLDNGYRFFFEIMLDDFASVFAKYPEYFKSHTLASPTSPTENPFSWAYGMEGSDWVSVIARTPENIRKFSIAISGKWSTIPAIGVYPFDELEDLSKTAEKQNRTFIVDVGGSQGATMKEIRAAYPQLKGPIVVEDLPHVIHGIPNDFLPTSSEITAMVHDFWKPQPIKNAAVYYLRRIMHDWPDDMCQKLLQHQTDAMAEDSVLLVADTVVPDLVQSEDIYPYWMDLTMFTFAGKERSAADWKSLFEKAGLELVKIWKAPVGCQGVIEGRTKRF